MPVFPTCDFPLLGDSATVEVVRSAVSAREPFSLIRLGDGEAIVLSFNDEMWLEDLAYLHGHWGSKGVTLGALAEVKRDLVEALRGADVVGIRGDILNVALPRDLLDRPGSEVKDFVMSAFSIRDDERENLSALGARRLALLHQALCRFEWSETQRFCSAWIHWELLASGELHKILEEETEIGLVTARPELQELVARRFDVRTTAVIVPDKFVEAPEAGRHVPDRYHTIRSELIFPKGTLVLVGAGIPGKAYCQWLKEAGCVAIDVGSVFDAWVGKASRPRVLESRFKVAGGNSVPVDLQLRLPVSPEHRLLTPRWKARGASE
jgi:hypothetical protein